LFSMAKFKTPITRLASSGAFIFELETTFGQLLKVYSALDD